MSIIHGRGFLGWLIDNGIVPKETRRVVIEASVEMATVIYVEQYGTEELIKVQVPESLKQAAVKVVTP